MPEELKRETETVAETDIHKKGPITHEQKQKRRRRVRRVLTIAVAAVLIVAAIVVLRKFVFKKKDSTQGEPTTGMCMRGSIMSMVQGSGTAVAKDSAILSPEAGFLVEEVNVAEGDLVEKDQPLYKIDDSTQRENIAKAQESVQSAKDTLRKAQDAIGDYDREIAKMNSNLEQLTVRAPHAGKLTEVNRELRQGDDAPVGTAVATVIDDTRLRLSLYYSWAYEGKFQKGDAAKITLPSLMAEYPGVVEEVNYVKRVVPEGGVTFEAVFTLDNPGTLTEGMTASASLVDSDGNPVYPYANGTLKYYQTTKLNVKVAGPVEEVHLMDYADVREGDVLLKLGDADALADISAKQNSRREAMKSVESAQKSVEDAEKNARAEEEKLSEYNASAPIGGRILSMGGLLPGEKVPQGCTIQIADTSTMLIDINIDERNVGYVTPGMYVDLQDPMGNYCMGQIESVALSAKAENGIAVFPAKVRVDNPDGTLMTNSYVNYSFVASQSQDCLVVPVQAVMNVSLAADTGMSTGADGGEVFAEEALPGAVIAVQEVAPGFSTTQGEGAFSTPGTATVCFVRGEDDGRGIPADETWNMPEGFYAVRVTTGLSDDQNVEIKEGLSEGDEVFTGYAVTEAWN